ncbi:MAG: response regulator transcription factor [Ferruginibacter sp.]
MQKILLIEDDPEIAKLLKLHFDSEQFDLTCSDKCVEALEKAKSEKYNLIILDITLPDGNGIDLCKQFRKNDISTPVIMLSCHSEESDKVLSLEVGADDYITKPFGVLELVARAKAVMRRTVQQDSLLLSKTNIIFSALSIDPDKRKVTLKGQRIELTVKEFDLLWLLASNPGKTFTRKQLLQDIWGFAFEGYEHTITSHINRLRLKLEDDLNHPEYILTAWGSGYRFAE